MLPHVIITRSYCSPARLLPPLSWRGSGQGQTETEYYHWGESCFMLPSGEAGSLSAPTTPPRGSRSLSNTGFTHSHSISKTSALASLSADLIYRALRSFHGTHAAHSNRSVRRFALLPPLPHSPSMAIERSISHFTVSYTFLCHSKLPLPFKRPDKGDRGGAARAFRSRARKTRARNADRASRGAALLAGLTGALCSSVSRPLGPEDTFSQRGPAT